MLRDIPIRWLLLVGFLFAGLLPVMGVALVGYQTQRQEMQAQAFRQLESVRDFKRAHLQRFFQERLASVELLAQDPHKAQVLGHLCQAFRQGQAAGQRFEGLNHRRFLAPLPYRQVHDLYVANLAAVVDHQRLYDLFLMDAKTGSTCFTVEKEADFGQPSAALPEVLREAWRAALAQPQVVLTDTRPYGPSDNAAAQFIAGQMKGDGGPLGVVVVQVSLDAINEIMGDRSGLPSTGESYLVGRDFRFRCDSPLEPLGHSVQASFVGAIPQHGAKTRAVELALAGQTGTLVGDNYRGRRVLSAYAPLDLGGLRWAILAEVEEAQVLGLISRALDHKVLLMMLVSGLFVVLLSLLVSWAVSRQIGQLRRLVAGLSQTLGSGLALAQAAEDAVGVDFRPVVARLNELLAAIARAQQQEASLREQVVSMQRLESLGTMAGGIAHEFNNILGYMYADLAIVKGAVGDNPEALHFLGRLGDAAARAESVVRQILSFSRQMKQPVAPLDPVPVLKDATELVQAALPRGVRLEAHFCPEGSLWLESEPTTLHQVLVNLVTNAAHSMERRGGLIRVSVTGCEGTEAAARLLVLEVGDQGEGMDSTTLARIFDPFFTTKPPGKGTGLGLSVVHGIVTQQGGKVAVSSVPGQGSTFTVTLPLLPRPGTPGPAPTPAAPVDEPKA